MRHTNGPGCKLTFACKVSEVVFLSSSQLPTFYNAETSMCMLILKTSNKSMNQKTQVRMIANMKKYFGIVDVLLNSRRCRKLKTVNRHHGFAKIFEFRANTIIHNIRQNLEILYIRSHCLSVVCNYTVEMIFAPLLISHNNIYLI